MIMVPFLDLIINKIMNYYHSNCVNIHEHCAPNILNGIAVSACFVCLTSIIEVGYINLTFWCIIVMNCSCSALRQNFDFFFFLIVRLYSIHNIYNDLEFTVSYDETFFRVYLEFTYFGKIANFLLKIL